LWFSFEAGLAHVIMLCSYCDYTNTSLQFAWLQQDLHSVDRARTPWLVALWHTPWYTTSSHHPMEEGAVMREAMEGLMYAHKVDIVLVGHLHAYERTAPVYANRAQCDGPVHIVIGDAGNHEGPACGWKLEEPDWEVIREFSFGHGILNLVNATHAQWSWYRNQDGEEVSADSVWLQPASRRCSHVHGSHTELVI